MGKSLEIPIHMLSTSNNLFINVYGDGNQANYILKAKPDSDELMDHTTPVPDRSFLFRPGGTLPNTVFSGGIAASLPPLGNSCR